MSSVAIVDKGCFFWNQVEQTKSIYSPDSPVIFQGKRIADNARDLQMQMFRACDAVDKFVRRLVFNPPKTILDLGAGMGGNTLPIAKLGSHVTAIERSEQLLQVFAKKSVEIGCPSENLHLRHGDITTMESYEGPFDVVVAVDILPYIPPKMLRSTMEKVQKSLEERGLLIGTIFTTDDNCVIREGMEQLGAHFYENGREFAVQLLEHSGFRVVQLEVRSEGGFRFMAEKY